MAGRVAKCSKCGTKNRLPMVTKGKPRCGECHLDLPWLVDAKAKDFDDLIRKSSLPVLVDLWAPWCGPCKAVAPVLRKISADRAGKLRIVKVNVDEEPSVSAKLGVKGIPTMVLYNQGKEVARQVGALPEKKITKWVDSSLR